MVYNLFLFQTKYIENLSHAQVMARASFSICAYHSSVVDIEWDAYATGCHVVLTFCKSAPPAHMKMRLLKVLSLQLGCTLGFLVSSSFTLLNALD